MDTFAFFSRALSVLGHLVPEAVGIEDEDVKQESGHNLRVAATALVTPDPQLGLTLSCGAHLERHGPIEPMASCNALTCAVAKQV